MCSRSRVGRAARTTQPRKPPNHRVEARHRQDLQFNHRAREPVEGRESGIARPHRGLCRRRTKWNRVRVLVLGVVAQGGRQSVRVQHPDILLHGHITRTVEGSTLAGGNGMPGFN